MKFSNVRLLVRDYEKCFRFYTEKLGLEAAFDIEGCYGSFKVAEGIEGWRYLRPTSWRLSPAMQTRSCLPAAGIR